MPPNISTPEGLLEALNMMINMLNELVAENKKKLKVSQSNACWYSHGHTAWKQRFWYQRNLPVSDKADRLSLWTREV